MRLLTSAIAALALAAAAGCSDAPQTEMHAANAALDAARTVEADYYAAATFHAAADTFEAAVTAMQQQSGRSTLARRYGRSRHLFELAGQLGRQAVTEARANMQTRQQRLRAEVAVMMAQAQAAVDSATATVEGVSINRGNRAMLDALRSDLVSLTSTLQEAQGDAQAGNYESARVRLEWVVHSAGTMPDKAAAALSKAAVRKPE